jgi:hypothetical protein
MDKEDVNAMLNESMRLGWKLLGYMSTDRGAIVAAFSEKDNAHLSSVWVKNDFAFIWSNYGQTRQGAVNDMIRRWQLSP